MSDTGFLDGWETKDTTEVSPPPPVKKEPPKKANVWGEEISQTTNTEGLSLEEIDTIEAENSQINKDLAKLESDKKSTRRLGRPKEDPKEPLITTFAPTAAQEGLPSGFGVLTATEQARKEQLRVTSTTGHVFCGIVMPPKGGKSSLVYDSLTDEEAESGAEIRVIDLDGHGRASVATNYPDRIGNILIINPYKIHRADSRVPYDFPASHWNVIEILQDALRQVDAQDAYFDKHGKMPDKWLKTVCIDNVGRFLKICELCMKILDLDLGPDAIAVAGQKTTTEVGWGNWYIRTNYYLAATDLMKELSRRGVHCYLLTHFKPARDSKGNEIPGEGTPDWLARETEKTLTQVVYGHIDAERDEQGRLTGAATSTATLTHNGLSLQSTGPITIYRQDPEGGEWYGWPSLRNGSFVAE